MTTLAPPVRRLSGTLRRPGTRPLLIVLLVAVLVGCGEGPPDTLKTHTATPEPTAQTEHLPLQKSGLAVGGDVEARATKVGEFPVSQAELTKIAKVCEGAQGIPVEGGDPCVAVQELPFRPCGPFDICVEIFAVRSAGFAGAGYAEVSDRRGTESLCESDPEAVCLRVGLTSPALARLTTLTPTATPTTQAPTETPTTGGPSPTPPGPTPSEPTPGPPQAPTGIASAAPTEVATVTSTP